MHGLMYAIFAAERMVGRLEVFGFQRRRMLVKLATQGRLDPRMLLGRYYILALSCCIVAGGILGRWLALSAAPVAFPSRQYADPIELPSPADDGSDWPCWQAEPGPLPTHRLVTDADRTEAIRIERIPSNPLTQNGFQIVRDTHVPPSGAHAELSFEARTVGEGRSTKLDVRVAAINRVIQLLLNDKCELANQWQVYRFRFGGSDSTDRHRIELNMHEDCSIEVRNVACRTSE